MAKRRLHSRKTKRPLVEFILEPGQSLTEFNKLKKLWDRKLKQAGHVEIEHISATGRTSRYFQGYNSQTIGANYSEATAEYFRRCGLYLHHANWPKLYPTRARYTLKWMWELWCKGLKHQEITDLLAVRVLKQARRSRKKDAEVAPASIYWVHTRIKELEQDMFDWFKKHPSYLD